jgi:hypothetical protein
VYDQQPPYRGFEIRTTAKLLQVEWPDVRDMAVRYLGKEAGEAYAAGASDSVLIRLEPGRVRAWDFADTV